MYQNDLFLMFIGVSAALLLVLLILLAILLMKLSRQGAAVKRLEKEVERYQEQNQNRAMQDMDHIVLNLHQMHDSIVSSTGEIGRSQNEQMKTLITQSGENARTQELRLRGLEESVARSLQQNESRIESLRISMEQGMIQMRRENTEALNEVRVTVGQKLDETLEKRLSGSFSQVSEQLEQVYRSLGEMHALAMGVSDLKRMLGNVKTRGVWGEVQLGNLLEQVLTDTQYQKNVEVVRGSGERVEYAVCLPGRDGGQIWMAIDSKFPQEDYQRLVQASEQGDRAATEAASKALLNSVRVEAKRIGKYISVPDTTDFAVMFLPLEGLYAEVMRHASDVEAIAREQRILIAGPSSLLALLNSLQMGFRTLAIEQRSAEVWQLLGTVKKDFAGFGTLLEKTQEKLRQATDSIDHAFIRTRTIEKHLQRVETLDMEEQPKLK